MSIELDEELAFEAVQAGDYERARQLLRQLLQQGSTYARDLTRSFWEPEERLAKQAMEGGEYQKAWEISTRLAHNGSVHAMYILGWLHEHRKAPDTTDEDALLYYLQAAEGGLTKAFYDAGVVLLDRLSDRQAAQGTFERGAALGSMQCMFGLGLCLSQGNNSEKIEAEKWFQKAASEGHIPSERKLISISAKKSLAGKLMFIPRLLNLIWRGVALHSSSDNIERLH